MIEFLTVAISEESERQIDEIFARFQQKERVSVETHFYGWDKIWRELVNVGIYRRGADMGEVGTTFLESLVAMNALRPFSAVEIHRFGGQSAYIPATWSATSFSGDDQVWGIPLSCDVRVIWYWKDMLDEATVDPGAAFTSHEDMQDTLEKLKAVTPTPWGMTTSPGEANIIHTLATWIWAFNGDFISADSKKMRVMEPASLEALRAYFGLRRYLPNYEQGLSSADVLDLFGQRKIAAFVAGPWVLDYFLSQEQFKPLIDRIAVSVMPGPAFVGGTVLSIWNHSRRIEETLKLAEFLLQPEVQVEYSPHLSLLPTRQEAWEMPVMKDDAHHQVIYQALSSGRSLPSVSLWGMVEEKLKACFSLIWKELMANPDADVDQTIRKYLEPTVTRLNMSLK